MDIQQIDQILNLIEKTSFIVVEVEENDLHIRVRKGKSPIGAPQNASQKNNKRFVCRSPKVGTFYRALPSSTTPAVEVGDLVEEGQILCIVQVLRIPIEVVAEMKGRIVSIYVENAQPVEYGEPLFEIETSEEEVKHVH